VAAVLVAEDRRRALVETGVAVAIVAGLVVIGLIIAKAIVLSNIEGEEARDAARAAWDSFFGDLRVLALGVGALGIVFSATAASVIVQDEVEDWVDRLRRVVTTQPKRRIWRLARALAIAGVSLFVILEPDNAIEVAVVILGGYGLFFGVGEMLQVLAPPKRGGIGSRDIDLDLDFDIDLPRLSPRAIAIAGGVALAVGVTVFVIASEDETAPAVERPDRPVTVCNGHEELCTRRLNEVTFAGTHNSMSSADERGWYFPGHRGTIRQQLDDGIRALLIDTHYGIRDDEGHVRTDLEREGTNRQKVVDAIGEEGLAAAERLVGRVGFGEKKGESGLYLCHTLCELGATPLGDSLTNIRRFLDENPDEFVIVFIQDAVSPEDTAKAFDRSGLTRYVHTHRRDEPWPQMRELIASDERLLVMAEEHGGEGPPWYHDGFELTQETPYVFHSLEEVEDKRGCEPNRGSPNSPLFLINHWIERVNPSPGLAEKVNDRDVLLRRARRCARRRALA
jgi:hypothetical protein